MPSKCGSLLAMNPNILTTEGLQSTINTKLRPRTASIAAFHDYHDDEYDDDNNNNSDSNNQNTLN
jgi:hypothetical protein